MMCGFLKVSKSGYYKWLNRKPSKHVQEEGRLEVEIKAAHKRTRETYGPEETGDTVQAEQKVQGYHRFQACSSRGREPIESAI
jgi:hypothetical protein